MKLVIKYFLQRQQNRTMSHRNGSGPKLELKLNLSPPRVNHRRLESSPNRSATVSPTSPTTSCVSTELNQEEGNNNNNHSTSPEEATSMVLVGCPRCLMYVMLSEDDPKCPKCKSTVLLDFLHDNNKRKS
ncbi:protein GL2-INTERACTING REPRESSOR 1-like [Lotus japonicus]|uniref:protein GL2-INTERACTING REPRESSOR 1-like n=1 Tax=Lotus japonicus TaxID=34305 RepID=UPI00258B51E9|nr:protein GL2-INTERACTING REPRESSOR 1-like [Lotus japonicus]